MEYALFLICGLAALLGTLAGLGGGIFVVPIMVMGFGIPIETAIGITAVSLIPSSLISSFSSWRKKNIDFKLIFLLEPPAMIGAILGAFITSLLPREPLERIFAGFLFFLAWRMARRLNSNSSQGPMSRFVNRINSISPHLKNRPYQVSYFAGGIFGSLAGLLAGVFGIGGGILKVPLMLNVFKIPTRTATGTSLMMIALTSVVSGFTHYRLGHVNPYLLAFSASGFASGAIAGIWVGVKIQDRMIGKIIAFSLLLAGAATLAHSIL